MIWSGDDGSVDFHRVGDSKSASRDSKFATPMISANSFAVGVGSRIQDNVVLGSSRTCWVFRFPINPAASMTT